MPDVTALGRDLGCVPLVTQTLVCASPSAYRFDAVRCGCHQPVDITCELIGMLYTVETFFTDTDGQRHTWAKPFVIAGSEVISFRETARTLIETLLEEGQPDGSHPIGLEIHDPVGEIVFAYLRPAPSQE